MLLQEFIWNINKPFCTF